MTGVVQRRADDCLRACVATILNVPIEWLPVPDFDLEDWIGGYNVEMRGGWPFELLHFPLNDHLRALPHRWIALVPSLIAPGLHAIVMDADGHLVWDPGRSKKYAEPIPLDVIKGGAVVVAVADGWGPGRDPNWQPRELNHGPAEPDDDAPSRGRTEA